MPGRPSTRSLAAAGNELLIICGSEGFGPNRTASADEILIASNVWKIIVVVPTGSGSTLDRITDATRRPCVIIACVMKLNDEPLRPPLVSRVAREGNSQAQQWQEAGWSLSLADR